MFRDLSHRERQDCPLPRRGVRCHQAKQPRDHQRQANCQHWRRQEAVLQLIELSSCYSSYLLRSRFSLFLSSPILSLFCLDFKRPSWRVSPWFKTSLVVTVIEVLTPMSLDIYRIVSTRQVGDSYGPASTVIISPTLPDSTDKSQCCSAL